MRSANGTSETVAHHALHLRQALQPMLPELLPVFERHNEFHCDRETLAKLLRISAASIDRLLKPERRKYELRGRSGTKPGTLLKKQIPIRTFAD